jgi:diguanylate cyclase (GGDEF)-like protein/PAS domain S-box-containing protein
VEDLEQFRRRAMGARRWSEEARRLAQAGHKRSALAAERLAQLADDEGNSESAAEHRREAARHRAAARRLALAGHELGARAAERLAELADDEGEPAAAGDYRRTAAHLRAEARRVAGSRVLDSVHEAFVAMDGGGFITDWSPQAESTFGWPRREAGGRVLAETIVPERYRRAHWDGLQRFLETGEGPVLGKRVEITALHRDGYEFPVELTISVVEESGRHRFYAVLHDISERKLSERHLGAQIAIGRVLGSHDSLSEAIPALLAAVGEAMEWQVGSYWSEAEPGRLTCRETWRAEPAFEAFERVSRELELAPGLGLPGLVWRSCEPAWLEDAGREPKPNFLRAEVAAKAGLHSAICLPVRKDNELIGALEFFSHSIQHPEPTLIETLTTLSAQIDRFVTELEERAALRRRLEALTRRDELTGLANRRAWTEELERELARSRREGRPLCVALLDLDQFEAVNERRGHAAGDALLREIAARWRGQLRLTDVLARRGGEDFAIALPARSLEVALAAVERLRAAPPSGMTCSAGLVAWDGQESGDQLLGRAEAALQRAKRDGSDQTATA